MDDETKKLLLEEIDLVRENNKLLKKVVRYQRTNRWLGTIKWIIIIGSAVGAFYYLQPIVDQLWGTYGNLLEELSDLSIKTLPSLNSSATIN